MALINLPIDLTRTASALEEIAKQLSRLGDAAERLSPMPPISHTVPYQATLKDLTHTDISTVRQIKEAMQEFATEHDVAVDSEAFFAGIMKFEREIEEIYGPEAVAELGWPRISSPLSRQEASRARETSQGDNAKAQGDQGRKRAEAEAVHQQQAARESQASSEPARGRPQGSNDGRPAEDAGHAGSDSVP